MANEPLADLTGTQLDCPECGSACNRDEVDIGVGIQYGPWRCDFCGWSEDAELPELTDLDVPNAP